MMGIGRRTAIALALVGATTAAGIGCHTDDCARLGTCAVAGSGGGGEGGGGQACIPGAAPSVGGCVDEASGVFVRADGSDVNDGSRQAPVRSLTRAASLAKESGRVVFVCAQIFDKDDHEVPAGVTLYGGLDCEQGWQWQAEKPTTLTRKASVLATAIPLTLLPADGEAETFLEDFEIVAPDALVPGGSSIAVIAREAKARFSRCTIRAGKGAHGALGGSGGSTPAPAGVAGNLGGAGGCFNSTQTFLGAAERSNPSCPSSIGGKGGNPAFATMNGSGGPQAGANGSPAWGTGQLGKGAPAQPSTGPWSCPNQDGAPGPNGEPGEGGTSDGSITDAGFVGADGADGQPGSPGQGGGGGGGSQAPSCPTTHNYGIGGGSGGSGGCGGAVGRGGMAGGSSIGILSIDAELVLEDTEVISGGGGNGGAGGAGQAGGPGADGEGPAVSGCGRGGSGGPGGHGGPGGGGRGGHSVAIMYSGMEPDVTNATLTTGSNGLGGDGGPGSPASSNGSLGVVQPLFSVPRERSPDLR